MPREQENRPPPDRDALRKKKEQEARLATSRLERRLKGRPKFIAMGEAMHLITTGVSGVLFYTAMDKSLPYLGLFAGIGVVVFARRVILYERLRRSAKRERKAFESLRGEKPHQK